MISMQRLTALVQKRVELEVEHVQVKHLLDCMTAETKSSDEGRAYLLQSQSLEVQLNYVDKEIAFCAENLPGEMSGMMDSVMDLSTAAMKRMTDDFNAD